MFKSCVLYEIQMIDVRLSFEEEIHMNVPIWQSGFGGLVVSMLASGTQVCGFKPGRSHLSHVAALWHVKEPYSYRGSRNCMAKFDQTFLAHSSTFH
jgi:hypothetical protein